MMQKNFLRRCDGFLSGKSNPIEGNASHGWKGPDLQLDPDRMHLQCGVSVR